MHQRIPSSCLFGLALSLSLVMFACDQTPAPPPAPSTPELRAAPVEGAPSEAKPQPALDETAPPAAKPQPALDEAAPVGTPTPAAVDDPAAAPTAEPVEPKEGTTARTKKPAKTFTDCQRDETFADGHCFATHEAACKALGCASDKCIALKSMPPQAKCL